MTKIFNKEKTLNNAIDSGLVIKSENKTYDRFRNRIMFPIRNSTGNIIGFGARIYNTQQGAKYLNSPETMIFHKSYELYGLFESKKEIAKKKYALIVEGYTDVIGLHKAGIKNCVATLGTAFTKFHFNKIKRYTNKIIFCFDGDSAGKSAAWKAVNNCLSEMKDEIQISILFLPQGCDPDTYIKDNKNDFDNLINNAIPLSKYIIDYLCLNLDVTTVEGKTSFALEAKKIINQMPDIIYTDILRKEIETICGNLLDKSKNINENKKDQKDNIEDSNFDIKELTLISLLVEYPKLINEFDNYKIVLSSPLQRIFNVINDEIKHNENFRAANLMNIFSNDELVKSIVSIETNEKSEDSARVTLNEILLQLEKNSNEKIYFNLLNRYSDGHNLSENEREFIKNFKK